MPRKGHTQKRDVLADPMYNNKVVTKLINNIMLDGKKGVAQKIVYGAFTRVEEKAGKPAIEVFEEAMNNIMPFMYIYSFLTPQSFFLKKVKRSFHFFQTFNRKISSFFGFIDFITPILAFIFIKQIIVIFLWLVHQIPFYF